MSYSRVVLRGPLDPVFEKKAGRGATNTAGTQTPVVRVAPSESASVTTSDTADIELPIDPVESVSLSVSDIADIVVDPVVDPVESASITASDVADIDVSVDPVESVSVTASDLANIVATADIGPTESASVTASDIADVAPTAPAVDPVESASVTASDLANIVATADIGPTESASVTVSDIADVSTPAVVDYQPKYPLLDTATAWWHANDITASTTINDQIGSNDLTINDYTAITNDGAHYYVEIDNTSAERIEDAGGTSSNQWDLDGSTDCTFVIVFATTGGTSASNRTILGKRYSTNYGYQLQLRNDVLTWSLDGDTDIVSQVDLSGPAFDDEGLLDVDVGVACGLSSSGGTQFIYVPGYTRYTASADAGNLDNSINFEFGSEGVIHSDRLAMKWYAAAIFKGTALTDAECEQAINELWRASSVNKDVHSITTSDVADIA